MALPSVGELGWGPKLLSHLNGLAGTYVTFVRSDNGQTVGGRVTIKVDPTTHEIVDIIWQA